MAYMSYCRYELVYEDLLSIYEKIEDDNLSDSEEKYREKLIKLCVKIANEYGEEE